MFWPLWAMLSSVLSLLGTSMSSAPFFSLLLPQKPTAPISNSSLRGRMHAFSREPQRKVRGFHLVVGWWGGYADHARGILHSVVLFSALSWMGSASMSWEVPSLGVGGVCGRRIMLSYPSSAFATGCVTFGKSRLLSVDGTLTRPKSASTTAKHGAGCFIYKSSILATPCRQGFYLNLPDEKTEAHKWLNLFSPGSREAEAGFKPK